MDPSGIRIGTQEITRIGFGKSEARMVAQIIHRAISTDASEEEIRNEVRELKSDFSEVKYCYGHHKAYEYISLFK